MQFFQHHPVAAKLVTASVNALATASAFVLVEMDRKNMLSVAAKITTFTKVCLTLHIVIK